MNAMLTDDLDQNYSHFIEGAIETGCVWGLQADDGWALCPAEQSSELDVMPLWSQPEYAKAHLVEEWASYTLVPISLEELLDEWLPGMHADVLLVGPNWNAKLEGEELEPLDLLEDFEETLAG